MGLSSSHGIRKRSGIVMLGIAVVALLTASMLMTPNASADDPSGTMTVAGYIYDGSSDVVADADVTVTTKDGETVMASFDTTSGPEGYYQITFGLGEYDFGCTIEVLATDGVNPTMNTSVAAVDAYWNWVDVTLSTGIPEFGISGLSTVVAVSGIIAVFIVVGRRRP